MELRQLLERISKTYDRSLGMSSEAQQLLRKASTEFQQWVPARYKPVGSGGKGAAAFVPWIAVFDTNETVSATQGMYVVYLFAEDMQTIALSLNQGVTELVDTHGTPTGRRLLKGQADSIRATLSPEIATGLDAEIDLRSRGQLAIHYEYGNILATTYTAAALPDEGTLVNDLDRFIRLYQEALAVREGIRQTAPEKIVTTRPTPAPGAVQPVLSKPKVFGHIAGHPVGSTYEDRQALHEAGVHTHLEADISGTRQVGADSIVVSSGYPDDIDHGDTVVYSGRDGYDPQTRKQTRDQELTDPGNASLVRSELEGLPIRVIRGRNVDSLGRGFRYDGLFRVESHGAQAGIDGFRIWQFTLVKIPDERPPTAPTPLPLQAPMGTFTAAPGPASVIETLVQRIIRNGEVARKVKAWHNHECQICGLALKVAGGLYSEGAHIQALGRPHHGPDVVENVLCLCPNDHVRFDSGAIYLSDDLQVIDAFTGQSVGVLLVHPSHQINPVYVAHHRARWTTGTTQELGPHAAGETEDHPLAPEEY